MGKGEAKKKEINSRRNKGKWKIFIQLWVRMTLTKMNQ